MTTPTPREFGALMRQIRDKSSEVQTEYRWYFGTAHDRTVQESVKVKGGQPRPTEDVATAPHKASERRSLTQAYSAAEDALAALRKAESALRSAEPKIRVGVEFDRRNPRTATRADLEESREAKMRREANGGGFGES